MQRKIILLLVSLILMAGCADKGKELYETAQFEEKQRNLEHAAQLYREIIKKAPDSEYAGKAAQRLAEIGRSK